MFLWQTYALTAIIIGFIIYLITYVLRKTGKIGKAKLTSAISRPLSIPGTPEKELATTKAENQRLRKEVERRDVLLAAHEEEKIKAAITKAAEENIQKILPEKVVLFDPERQLTGRPVYLHGGWPLLDTKQEVERLVQTGKWRLLAKIHSGIAKGLCDFLYFRGAHTLYYYTAQLLPDSKWVITATSRPAQKKGKYMKLPGHVLTYVIGSSEQPSIDGLFLNRYEVTRGNAAIHLASTIFGPFPAELYGKLEASLGWTKNVGETEEKRQGEGTIAPAVS